MTVLGHSDFAFAAEFLRSHGTPYEAGLSDAEFDRVEAEFEIVFPPDLRAFLAIGLPVGESFPDWRDGDPIDIRTRLEWPARGILIHAAEGEWQDFWGELPSSEEEAVSSAGALLDAAPKLIPIYSHRYIPMTPAASGNPVFSVYQTDTIIYGSDLMSYLGSEFGVPQPPGPPAEPRRIDYWSDLVDLMDDRRWR